MQTWTWDVDTGSGPELEMRTKELALGNGYEQVSPDGLNTVREIWSISKFGYKDELLPLWNFLKSHGGHKKFLWTTPLGDTIMVRGVDVSMPHKGADTFTLSATFKQSFAP